jgi:hypothetical protein
MSDEHVVSLQSSMQFLPTRLPVIVLWRVEEQFPAFRVTVVTAMYLCAEKELCHIILRNCKAQRTYCFLGILCSLSFSVVSVFRVISYI